MPKLANKEICCGCAACYSACPKVAISMTADETGFLYPVIDPEKCVECGKCVTVCPALSEVKRSDSDISYHAFIGQHRDPEIRRQSTSGGLFTAIAEQVIGAQGVVFGAAMDNEFTVSHKYVSTVDDLREFRNSKYVQSEIKESFKECKEFLDKGIEVCFSGTPCQIHGLKKFLGKEYDNLLTVDIVCHSVPSPLIFKKYIEYQQSKIKFDKVVFRDKAWGYSYSTMALYDDGNCVYRGGSESDLWFRSFLPGLCDRENCYNCQFQKWPRISDITIWDCFTVGKIDKTFDDNQGTTSIMVWSEKGLDAIKSIDANKRARILEVPSNTFENKIERETDKKIQIDRKQMYKDAKELKPKQFFDKYRPDTWKVKAKAVLKKILFKTGLLNISKKLLGF